MVDYIFIYIVVYRNMVWVMGAVYIIFLSTTIY